MASQEVLSALDKLHKELDKLEPAIKHVETAQQVTQSIKAIPQKHLDLLNEIREHDTIHKNQLKDLFSKELTRISEENKALARTSAEIQLQVKAEQQALADLNGSVLRFHDRVVKIDFPERFINLETVISELAKSVQDLQSRLENLERNTAARNTDILNQQIEVKEELKAALDQGAQKQQTMNYITWALIAATIIASLVMKSGL